MKEELIQTENREEEKTEQAPATVPAETDGKLPLPGKAEWVLAALILAAAYIYYSCWMPVTWLRQKVVDQMGIGWQWLLFGFTCLFVAAGLIYARMKKQAVNRGSLIYLALTGAAALWFVIYQPDDQPIMPYVFLFLSCVAVYWLTVLAGKQRGGCLDARAPGDRGRGLFYLPFAYFGRWWAALASLAGRLTHSRQAHRDQFRQALLGVLLSIPVLCIVLLLLVRADSSFARAIDGLLPRLANLFSVSGWLTAVLVVLIAMYLFGMFYGTFYEKRPEAEKRVRLPQAFLGGFLVMFVALYLIFFIIKLLAVPESLAQIAQGTLLTSTYARDGFFELCAIAFINFLIFSVIKWYSPDPGLMMKAALSILGVQTLAFICLAFSKMGLYIDTYGLTFKRVFTSWFMAVLFLTFVLLVGEIWKKFNGVRIAVMTGAVTFLILAYSNMPAWMAAYNAALH